MYDSMAHIEMTIYLLSVYLLKQYKRYCSFFNKCLYAQTILECLVYEYSIFDFHQILIWKEWYGDQNNSTNVGNTFYPQM